MLPLLVKAVTDLTSAHAGPGAMATAIDGLLFVRSDHERQPNHLLLTPALCVVVQGAKRTMVGDTTFSYGAGQALVVSVEVPAVGHVLEASPLAPYLGVIVELDVAVMREVQARLDAPPRASGESRSGVFVTDFDGPLFDCVLRLVRLLETPKAVELLAPAIMREISYWLLTGPNGAEVAKMTLAHGHAHHVVRAINTLRLRFTETVRVEELAALTRLSPSAFHRHFKAVTSMSPLQYQKQLRLLEARRLMVAEDLNVETAAFRVGYESPSQFSREYARKFGRAPRRDVAALKLVPVTAI